MEAPAFPDDAVEVGRILGAWGVKGWIKIDPYSADPQALFSSRRWHLLPPEGLPAAPALPAARVWTPLLSITQAREHGDAVVASAREIVDRDSAQALRGGRIFVSRGSFPTPDEGEFYWVDLIGLSVINRAGLPLGVVVGLLDSGPHSILRIQPAQGDEVLIPFVDAYVDAVDVPGRQIRVDWLPDY